MTLTDRRRMLISQEETANINIVASFDPVTQSFEQNTAILVSLTEAIVKGRQYRVVLDATVQTGYSFLVVLGALNNTLTPFPEGQDGVEEEVWTTSTGGSTTTARAYIFCRPISGTGTVTATIRNIKVYKEGLQ